MSYRSNPKFYCERCNGDGGWADFYNDKEIFFTCPDCIGTGMLTTKKNKHGESTGEKRTIRENNKHISADIIRDTNTASKQSDGA